MTFGISAFGNNSVQGSRATGTAIGSASGAGDDGVEAFLREAKKTPAERTKDAVLKRHNLSQEQFDALSQEQQASIRKEIEDEMKRKLGRAQGGAFADVVV